MSTYITNTHPSRQDPEPHSWFEFTERRLAWLYGPHHATERAAMTQADLAAWRGLGMPKDAA